MNNSATSSKPNDNKYSTIKRGAAASSSQNEAEDRPQRNSLGTMEDIDAIQEDIKEEDPDFNGEPNRPVD